VDTQIFFLGFFSFFLAGTIEEEKEKIEELKGKLN